MSYKVAIASSDGVHVDLAFGEAREILIVEVNEENRYQISETRHLDSGGAHCEKIEALKDCRCVVCAKIGPGAKRQAEMKEIPVFDIEGEISYILYKIMSYYSRMDH